MWQTIGPVAAEMARRAARRKGEKASPPVAASLERMGRSLELVSRLVRMDVETGGRPIVTRHDRELATDLLTSLLTNPVERRAYLAFLETVEAKTVPFVPPDPLARAAIHQQHWAQLSSAFLAGLLLNRTGVEQVAADLVASRPVAWEAILPKPRARSSPAASRPSRRAKR